MTKVKKGEAEKEKKGEEVFVESACKLTDEERERIEKIAAGFVGNKVELKVKIDESLIGGFRVTIRSVVLDISLKESLNRAGEALLT